MGERPGLLALDLLESYARERDIDVSLERWKSRREWACLLSSDGIAVAVGTGRTARAAIIDALGRAGVDLSELGPHVGVGESREEFPEDLT